MTSIYNILIPKSKDKNLWAKTESQNPTGTHKDRSISKWISHYLNQGVKEFVISSSGNSAVSASKYCSENAAKLHVFVPPNIDDRKIATFRENKSVILNISKTPKRDALRFSSESGVMNLRASTDDNALLGYKNIAFELSKQFDKIDSIFIPTSSGTTLEGMHMGFAECGFVVPAFYAIQTTKVHPIASYFDSDFKKESKSHAKAIVDNIAHRRARIIKILKDTGGGGFVISDSELEDGKRMLEACNVMESAIKKPGWQSILSFAGYLKWKAQNHDKKGLVSVCLFTD